jgi:hypothetical protein
VLVKANAKHRQLKRPHVFLNGLAHCLFTEVVKQAISAKVGNGHAKLACALVVAHEVVFVVTGEDTS